MYYFILILNSLGSKIVTSVSNYFVHGKINSSTSTSIWLKADKGSIFFKFHFKATPPRPLSKTLFSIVSQRLNWLLKRLKEILKGQKLTKKQYSYHRKSLRKKFLSSQMEKGIFEKDWTWSFQTHRFRKVSSLIYRHVNRIMSHVQYISSQKKIYWKITSLAFEKINLTNDNLRENIKLWGLPKDMEAGGMRGEVAWRDRLRVLSWCEI